MKVKRREVLMEQLRTLSGGLQWITASEMTTRAPGLQITFRVLIHVAFMLYHLA